MGYSNTAAPVAVAQHLSATQGCEAAPTEESIVPSLATVYEHLVKLTPPCKSQITRFHAIKPPEISIKEYLERIRRYFGCSNECFVLSLVYIDRIVKIHDDFSVSILNVHRLLITSVMLAAKFFDDVYYSNAFYARVGGVRTREINILEAHFLSLLDFHLFVSPQEYDQYRQNVLAAVSYQNGQRNVRSLHPSDLPHSGQNQESSGTGGSLSGNVSAGDSVTMTMNTPTVPPMGQRNEAENQEQRLQQSQIQFVTCNSHASTKRHFARNSSSDHVSSTYTSNVVPSSSPNPSSTEGGNSSCASILTQTRPHQGNSGGNWQSHSLCIQQQFDQQQFDQHHSRPPHVGHTLSGLVYSGEAKFTTCAPTSESSSNIQSQTCGIYPASSAAVGSTLEQRIMPIGSAAPGSSTLQYRGGCKIHHGPTMGVALDPTACLSAVTPLSSSYVTVPPELSPAGEIVSHNGNSRVPVGGPHEYNNMGIIGSEFAQPHPQSQNTGVSSHMHSNRSMISSTSG